MAGKRKGFSQAQQNEMRKALMTAPTEQAFRRFAILLAIMTSDRSLCEIARDFGVSPSLANQLARAYRKDGLAGVVPHKKGGNRRNMSLAEEAELLAEFRLRLANEEQVAISEIHSAYERRLGRPVSKSVVYYMLARHEWPKRPTRRAEKSENS